MERLGPSLKDIREQVSKKLSLKNVLMIGIELVRLFPFPFEYFNRSKELSTCIIKGIFIEILNQPI